jgi:cellulose synthase/poly-beta-1,6-N-acetylglucosamine synthase-like glycosyltransferase
MDPASAVIVVTILRIFIYMSVIMIYLPAVVYTFFFGKFGILWEVVVGSPSYLFYLPTYVCILPIYSKCRLDDVPTGRHQKLK